MAVNAAGGNLKNKEKKNPVYVPFKERPEMLFLDSEFRCPSSDVNLDEYVTLEALTELLESLYEKLDFYESEIDRALHSIKIDLEQKRTDRKMYQQAVAEIRTVRQKIKMMKNKVQERTVA